MIMKRIVTFLGALVLTACAPSAVFAQLSPDQPSQQPAHWNYSINNNGISTAYYPGIVSAGQGPTPVPISGCANIEAYGGNVASADNTAAVNNWLASTSGKSSCIQFGAGTYRFTSASPISVSLVAAQTLNIQGSAGTVLEFTNAGGFNFVWSSPSSSVNLFNLTLTTDKNGTGKALSFDGSAAAVANNYVSNLVNVDCRGEDAVSANGTQNYWGYCFWDHDAGWINLYSPHFWGSQSNLGGTGFYMYGDNGTDHFPVLVNIFGGDIQNFNHGVEWGPWSQGSMITGTTIAFNNVGVITSGSGYNSVQLAITNSEFENYQNNYVDDVGIYDGLLSNNLFFNRSDVTGVLINAGARYNISGNDFTCSSLTNSYGVNVVANQNSANVLVGNIFNNCYYGYYFNNPDALGWVAGQNSFIGNTNDYYQGSPNSGQFEIGTSNTSFNSNGLNFSNASSYIFYSDVSVIGSNVNFRLHTDANNGYLLGNTANTGFNSYRPFTFNYTTGRVSLNSDGLSELYIGGSTYLPASTLAGLPACTSGTKGALRVVTDALSPTYNSAISGAGMQTILALCDGTSWKAH